MVYIMVIITLATETCVTITTKSYVADAINWAKIMKVMKDDPQYSYKIRIVEVK